MGCPPRYCPGDAGCDPLATVPYAQFAVYHFTQFQGFQRLNLDGGECEYWECFNNGLCQSQFDEATGFNLESCQCLSGFEGSQCESVVPDLEAWNILSYVMLSVWAILFLFCGLIVIWMVRSANELNGREKFPFSAKVIMLFALAALTRVLFWAIDPLALEGEIYPSATYVLGGLYAPLSLVGLSLLLFNWAWNFVVVSMTASSTPEGLQLHRQRLWYACLFSIGGIPISIVADTLLSLNKSTEMYIAALALNLIGILWYILTLGLLSFLGVSMYLRIKKVKNKNSKKRKRIIELTFYHFLIFLYFSFIRSSKKEVRSTPI